MNKRVGIGLAVVLVLGVAAAAVIAWKSDSSKDVPQDTNNAAQTFTGTTVCLPKPGDGPHTMECSMGLKASDQKYYALKNNPQQTLPTDSTIKVTGKVIAPSADEVYDISGTIDVESIETIK